MSQQVDCLHFNVPIVDTETGLPSHFFQRWLYCIWSRTGGNQDFISDLQNADIFITDKTDSNITQTQKNVESVQKELLSGRSTYFENYNFPAKEISIDYTTYRNQILICIAAITVTLNPRPKINERVYIKRTNGKVTIIGPIDNHTNLILTSDNACVTLLYTQSGWWIL